MILDILILRRYIHSSELILLSVWFLWSWNHNYVKLALDESIAVARFSDMSLAVLSHYILPRPDSMLP